MVGGLQLGNVFIGVQPLLGLEGDPMRLMFERDLTPHPQYAAFYQWLKGKHEGFGAQVRKSETVYQDSVVYGYCPSCFCSPRIYADSVLRRYTSFTSRPPL